MMKLNLLYNFILHCCPVGFFYIHKYYKHQKQHHTVPKYLGAVYGTKCTLVPGKLAIHF